MADYFKWDEKKERLALFAALALGFVLRASYVVNVNLPPHNDMAEWDKARLSIINSLPYTANWTPLYPAVLALITKVFGESYVVLNLANAVFSIITCYYIFLSAREIFGKRTAYLALLFSAVYIDMIWYCGVMMAETLGMMLLTVLVYRVIKNRSFAVSGLFLGLTCLTKGLFIVLLPGFLVWIYQRERKAAWLRKSAVFTGMTFLTLLPWSVRNIIVHKAPVLLEPHWASAMFAGHNPYATGGYDYEYLNHEDGKFELDPALSIVEKNRLYTRKALDFMLHNPLRELQLTALRASKHLTFATSFVAYREPYPARKLMFGLSLLQNMILFPLCALGMAFSFRDRGAFGFSMIITILAGVFITIFSANTRMRMPLVPAMLTLAAHGAILLPGILARVKSGEIAEIKCKLFTISSAVLLLYANFAYQAVTRWQDVAGRFN